MSKRGVLFAGGGTGGHIYPNVAITERLSTLRPDLVVHFAVSNRPGDAGILANLDHPFTPSPVQTFPPPSRPWRALPFLLAWRRALRETRALIAEHGIACVVATGGFVSGPPVVAATQLGVPRALVNLDARPGKANRRLVKYSPKVFSVFATPELPGAELVGLPLRTASRSDDTPADAKTALGFDRHRPLLFVTGATHGAESIVRMMIAWARSPESRAVLGDWQILHQCGSFPTADLERAYSDAGLLATVVGNIDKIGLAFRAADLAVARAGAGTVAEAWANATPTLFLPNPYHRDEHQRHNAQPMVEAGGAAIARDRIDVAANLAEVVPKVIELLRDREQRMVMRAALTAAPLRDGATIVADWISASVPR